MSRRSKKHADVQEEEGSNWLISYADMMTLIACFFILLIAFAHFDPVGFNKKVEIVSKHFLKDKYKSSQLKMQELQEEIVKHPEILKKTKITVTDSQLAVTFSGSSLYEEGEYKIDPQSLIVLDSMIEIIKNKNPNYQILVEGHTHQQEVAKLDIIKSSRELSAMRSAQIIDRFEFYGMDPLNLVAVGKGDSEPIAPNFDKKGNAILKNQQLNRRIVIKVIEPLNKKGLIRMGLGVYFEE